MQNFGSRVGEKVINIPVAYVVILLWEFVKITKRGNTLLSYMQRSWACVVVYNPLFWILFVEYSFLLTDFSEPLEDITYFAFHLSNRGASKRGHVLPSWNWRNRSSGCRRVDYHQTNSVVHRFKLVLSDILREKSWRPLKNVKHIKPSIHRQPNWIRSAILMQKACFGSHVSRKSRKRFGPETPFQKLRSAGLL